MSIEFAPTRKYTESLYPSYQTPITSKVPLGTGSYYRVRDPIPESSVLSNSNRYQDYLADPSNEKHCLVHAELYIGLDADMSITISLINGPGRVNNSETAKRLFKLEMEKSPQNIEVFDIHKNEARDLLDNQLIKLG